MYSKSLVLLSAALQDEDEGLSSDTLSAVLLLSFFEVFNCTEENSWRRHAGGAGPLIRLRGPERHRLGFGRLVFLSFPHSIILQCYINRSPCFLDTAPWRKLDQDMRDTSSSGSPISVYTDDFYREVMSLPRYLRDVCAEIVSAESPSERRQTLHDEGLAHRTRLQEILTHVNNEMGNAGHAIVEKPSQVNDPTFPVVFHYPNCHFGSLLCALWAVISNLNTSLVALEAREAGNFDPLSAISGNSMVIATIGSQGFKNRRPFHGRNPLWDAAKSYGASHRYSNENVENARKICKSAEYMAETPFLGPLFLNFFLRVAARLLVEQAEEHWLARKLFALGEQTAMARLDIVLHQRSDQLPP